MKKVYLLLLLIMTTVFSIKGNEHKVSLGASIGLLHGQGEEIVYRDADSKDKLSQLLWNFKPIVYAGVDIHYSWRKSKNKWGIFADTLFKVGFPGKTGVMEDRDWIAMYYPDFLTHYSVHTNKTKNAILIDANAGASFQVFETFLLKTYIAYNYMLLSWVASGGSFLYPASEGDHGYLTTPMDVGTYQQTWHIISPAIAFYGAFNTYFDIELSLKASPFIWCAAEDNHILRTLLITENMYGGFFIEPGLVFSFNPKDSFSLSFSIAYKNISGTRGTGEYKEQGQPTITAKNISGAGYAAWDAGISAKFRIF